MSRANMASARMTDPRLQHHKANVYISATRTPPTEHGIPYFALATSALRRLFPHIPGPLYSEDPDVPALYLTISPEKPKHPVGPFMSMPVTFDTLSDSKRPQSYQSLYPKDAPNEFQLPRGPTVPSQPQVDANPPPYSSPHNPDHVRNAVPPQHHTQQHYALPPQTYQSPYPLQSHPPHQQYPHDPAMRRPSNPANPPIPPMQAARHAATLSVSGTSVHGQEQHGHRLSPLAPPHQQRQPPPPTPSTASTPRAPEQPRRVSFASIFGELKNHSASRAPWNFQPPVVGPSPVPIPADQAIRKTGTRQESISQLPVLTSATTPVPESKPPIRYALKAPVERSDAIRIDSPFLSHKMANFNQAPKRPEPPSVAQSPVLPSPTGSTSGDSVRSVTWNRSTAWASNDTKSTPDNSQAATPVAPPATLARGVSFRAWLPKDESSHRPSPVKNTRLPTPESAVAEKGSSMYWSKSELSPQRDAASGDQPSLHGVKDTDSTTETRRVEVAIGNALDEPKPAVVQTIDLTVDEDENKDEDTGDRPDLQPLEAAGGDEGVQTGVKTSAQVPSYDHAAEPKMMTLSKPITVEAAQAQAEVDQAKEGGHIDSLTSNDKPEKTHDQNCDPMLPDAEDVEDSIPLWKTRKAQRKLNAPSFATRQDVRMKASKIPHPSDASKIDKGVETEDSAIDLSGTMIPATHKRSPSTRVKTDPRLPSSSPFKTSSSHLPGKRKRTADPELDSEPEWKWKVQKVTWKVEQDDGEFLDEIVAEL